MKKYITIAGAVLLGHVSAQENLAAAELSVESPNSLVYYVNGRYVDPLSLPEHQLKEQAYLEAMQKIYGTTVQSPQIKDHNDDPLADVLRETKQADYLQMLQNIQDGPVPAGPNPLGLTAYQLKEQAILKAYQNIYGNNVQEPKVQQDPLSDLEREMKQATYLSGMQNIYGHYANVQSPQWGYYDPLYQQKHQLKEQSYLETMQKIYGTKVQDPKIESAYNIYEHYNVQARHPVDPLQQTEWELKEQAKLEALQKIYGNKVQSGNPLSDLEREMKQATYLNGMQNIYGHYANVQSQKSQYKWGNIGQIRCIRAPCPIVESPIMDIMHKNHVNYDYQDKIYGPQVQKHKTQDYDPLAEDIDEIRHIGYIDAIQKNHGYQKNSIDIYKVQSELRSTRRQRNDWEDDE
ncbi:UNKNOWN [Stylonychia lemnae]|uniref:Uncharacterized protein n=1 Tax=Stylonychia lemnae TaxID=5949 RepID=A0A078B8Z1_STYLE|nr:UNKNOWN [Stylonychia lemnae]|eukprot:CDW90018.1 UNKNOWN [Stylonychia lemnae]